MAKFPTLEARGSHEQRTFLEAGPSSVVAMTGERKEVPQLQNADEYLKRAALVEELIQKSKDVTSVRLCTTTNQQATHLYDAVTTNKEQGFGVTVLTNVW